MLRRMMFAGLFNAPPVAGGRVVKINLYGNSVPTSIPGWNNFDISNASINLLDSTGAATGFTLSRNMIGAADGPFTVPTSNDVDFPADVLRMEWYISENELLTFTFSGLNISKTYTIKTASYDPGSVGTSVITFGTTQSGAPGGTPLFFTFPNLTPNSSGIITGALTGPNGSNPVINALIITEN